MLLEQASDPVDGFIAHMERCHESPPKDHHCCEETKGAISIPFTTSKVAVITEASLLVHSFLVGPLSWRA